MEQCIRLMFHVAHFTQSVGLFLLSLSIPHCPSGSFNSPQDLGLISSLHCDPECQRLFYNSNSTYLYRLYSLFLPPPRVPWCTSLLPASLFPPCLLSPSRLNFIDTSSVKKKKLGAISQTCLIPAVLLEGCRVTSRATIYRRSNSQGVWEWVFVWLYIHGSQYAISQ